LAQVVTDDALAVVFPTPSTTAPVLTCAVSLLVYTGILVKATEKAVNFGGLVPNAEYTVTNTCFPAVQTVTASEQGVLSFPTTFATGCVVTATQL
jgi:hypothetical protein